MLSLLKRLKRMDEFLVFIFFIIMFLFVLLEICARFLPNVPLYWLEEFVRYVFGYMVFFGVVIAIKSDDHICISVFLDKLSPKKKAYFKIISHILFISFIVMFLIFTSIQVKYYYAKHMNTVSITIPLYLIRIPIIISFFMGIFTLIKKIKETLINEIVAVEKGSNHLSKER